MGTNLKKLLSGSSIVFVGTIIASFFSYLFNMLMGRMLGPSQYGEMAAILSLLTMLSVGGGAILTVVMRYSSELNALGKNEAIKKLFLVFSRYLIIAALVIFLVGSIFSGGIAYFFSIERPVSIVIGLAGFFFGFPILVSRGILQGLQKFLPLSILNITEMSLRLVLGILFVKIGFAVNGAIGATIIATGIVYLLTLLPLKKLLWQTSSRSKGENYRFDKKELLNYSLPALISSVLLAVSLNMDVLLVKHYFSAEQAGLYAAVSTIAKIILYVTAPIISVMFPMISEHQTKGSKHYQVFLFSLLLTMIGSFIILGAYMVAPAKIIALLYGTGYIGLYSLLPEIGIAILFYSLVNLLVNYYLAIKDFVFIWAFILVIIGQVIAISLWHPSLVAVVRVLISAQALLFILMLGYYFYTKKNQLTSYFRGEYSDNDD